MSRPAVFLDRDGTIIEEVDYLSSEDQVTLLPSAAPAIRALNAGGYTVVVVTNQSGVARGLFDERRVRAVHEAIDRLLEPHGARIDAYYYCPHLPDASDPRYRQACECRKPAPGLLLQAQRDLDVDLRRSWIVGDRWRDVAAGGAAGARGILVRTGYGAGDAGSPPTDVRADAILNDLMEAADWILRSAR